MNNRTYYYALYAKGKTAPLITGHSVCRHSAFLRSTVPYLSGYGERVTVCFFSAEMQGAVVPVLERMFDDIRAVFGGWFTSPITLRDNTAINLHYRDAASREMIEVTYDAPQLRRDATFYWLASAAQRECVRFQNEPWLSKVSTFEELMLGIRTETSHEPYSTYNVYEEYVRAIRKNRDLHTDIGPNHLEDYARHRVFGRTF